MKQSVWVSCVSESLVPYGVAGWAPAKHWWPARADASRRRVRACAVRRSVLAAGGTSRRHGSIVAAALEIAVSVGRAVLLSPELGACCCTRNSLPWPDRPSHRNFPNVEPAGPFAGGTRLAVPKAGQAAVLRSGRGASEASCAAGTPSRVGRHGCGVRVGEKRNSAARTGAEQRARGDEARVEGVLCSAASGVGMDG